MKVIVKSVFIVVFLAASYGRLDVQAIQSEQIYMGRRAVAWKPDGSQLAIGTWEGKIIIVDSFGIISERLDNLSSLVMLTWSPDGKMLASIDIARNQKIWETSTWKLKANFGVLDTPYHEIQWSFDSKKLLIANYSSGIYAVWDVNEHKVDFDGGGDTYGIAWSSDGSRFAIGGSIRLEVRDSTTNQLLKSVSPLKSFIPSTQVAKVTWSPDGTRLVTSEFDSGEDEILRVWDAKTLTLLKQYRVPGKMIFSMEWSSDGKRLLTTSHANTVKIWNVDDGTFVEVYQGTEPLIGAVWNPLNDRVAIVKNTVTSQNIAQQFTTISVANLK